MDVLRAGLGIGSNDPSTLKMRAYCCSALAQLAASHLTLPLLLGHPVLNDLEQLAAGIGVEAEDAKAALFATRETVAQDSRPKGSADHKHIMLSYQVSRPSPPAVSISAEQPSRALQWDAQAIVKRIDESLKRRGYSTWFDLTNMTGAHGATSMIL